MDSVGIYKYAKDIQGQFKIVDLFLSIRLDLAF